MQKLLVKLFIKDYQKIHDSKVRSRYGTLSGIVGIISNLILCSMKIILGILTASLSILADGINNLTDAGSSVITLIGFKLSSVPADEDHPFGHERIEYITGLIISFFILIIGFSLGKESITKLIHQDVTQNISIIVIIVMIISILIKLWQSIFYRKMAKAINSEALVASSKDSLNDCISTAAVIIGLILFKLTSWQPIDSILGIVVAIFITISGLKMVFETVNPLIGTKPSQDEIDAITKKILSHSGIIGIHDLVIRHYGNCTTFATVHAEVPSDEDIVTSHDIIDNIEREFRNELGIDLTIHMDPVDIKNPQTNELKEKILHIVKDISPDLSIHDFRVVYGETHTNLVFDVAMPIKFSCTKKELRELIISEIKKIDENYFAIIQIDQLYNRNEQ